jgi:acyl transferase domain-containing protein
VNTVCASSLAAVDRACQGLQSGEVKVALAGAVNLFLAPESTGAMCKSGAMAPDGRLRAFDTGAVGYVRGEGGEVLRREALLQE